jgi:internalin A
MRSPMLCRFLTPFLILFLGSAVLADDPTKPSDREAALAKLKANKVSLLSLTIESKDGGPAINLGTGPDGGEANNATDENLRLIAQLPELERVMMYKGKVSADGLAALAALPNLRYLQMYATDVPAAAFAVLPKLTQLKSLSLGGYPVTDELLGYAGQIKGLKGFDHTQSAMTPTGFLKFLNGVESLEQLTLFGDYVDDACMKRIGQMKDLKRFWTDSKKITSAGWVHLAGLTKMQDLFLSSTNFGDDDTAFLEGMKDLKFLGLNKTKITDAGMPSLVGLTKLHDLGLDGTKITDKGMVAMNGMTELDNLYVGMTDVTTKGLALVPRKDRMVMMRTGKGALSAKQLDELMQMYPKTQIFDPSGYWTPDRIKAAMKTLGKEWPQPKEIQQNPNRK